MRQYFSYFLHLTKFSFFSVYKNTSRLCLYQIECYIKTDDIENVKRLYEIKFWTLRKSFLPIFWIKMHFLDFSYFVYHNVSVDILISFILIEICLSVCWNIVDGVIFFEFYPIAWFFSSLFMTLVILIWFYDSTRCDNKHGVVFSVSIWFVYIYMHILSLLKIIFILVTVHICFNSSIEIWRKLISFFFLNFTFCFSHYFRIIIFDNYKFLTFYPVNVSFICYNTIVSIFNVISYFEEFQSKLICFLGVFFTYRLLSLILWFSPR